jgi:hypothetical protein
MIFDHARSATSVCLRYSSLDPQSRFPKPHELGIAVRRHQSKRAKHQSNNIGNGHGNAYIGDTHFNVEPATLHVLSAEKTHRQNDTVTRFRYSCTVQIN